MKPTYFLTNFTMELGIRKDVRVSKADFSKKSADHVLYTVVFSSKAWMKWAFDENKINKKILKPFFSE